VFIPHLSGRFYEKWDKELKDRFVRNPFDLPPILQKKLTQLMPWAEAATPNWGGSTGQNLNQTSQRISVNGGIHLKKHQDDTITNPNDWKVGTIKEEVTYVLPQAPLDMNVSMVDNSYNNASMIRGKLTEEQYTSSTKDKQLEDKFPYYPYKDTEEKIEGSAFAYDAVMQTPEISFNQYGRTVLVQQLDYIGWASKPSNIGSNGSVNGMFSVPSLGAKVWVYFANGDFQSPVYFASAVEPSVGIGV
jgi:hypothetical protein